MIWEIANRADPRCVDIADRHYSRQKPGTPQFMPTGSAFVLYHQSDTGSAVWGTSWPQAEWVRHDWAGAWMCSIFRNESGEKASKLIRDAMAATRWHYGDPPELGMVTFVKEDAVRGKANPGHSFIIAGFRPVGRTKTNGLLALQIMPDKMPKAQPPFKAQMRLW